ncbi:MULTISPECIES: FxLYD domain-containing protein [Streptomyces]|jgi:hypothetical protein|uniref:FxLYD domain-containing protein n=1 Tax=Streptomyces fuscus TaxID=3048495 RepID=A0ABT7J1C0_9ACTN|nr:MULTISPECIES: FxLYD domain-containing protein [Streptomyces]MCM1971654.1 FxLYD domain-containing protein [Streptomyces sp. G1]MDL2078654.1 FxLYD domain-containing protein [Streptomyces fuscus]SBT90077.1 hypothetical protein GA0115233_101529 [Streptomyces sp. DI166]
MSRHRTLCLLSAAALAASAALTSCSDDDTPSSVVSRAQSAAESLASEADRRFQDVKNGVNAKDEVTLGKPSTSGGKAEVTLTAKNTADSTKSFLVQIDFTDENGNRLDTTVVTVSDVGAGATKDATARSRRDLSGDVQAKVARALRY